MRVCMYVRMYVCTTNMTKSCACNLSSSAPVSFSKMCADYQKGMHTSTADKDRRQHRDNPYLQHERLSTHLGTGMPWNLHSGLKVSLFVLPMKMSRLGEGCRTECCAGSYLVKIFWVTGNGCLHFAGILTHGDSEKRAREDVQGLCS